MKDNKFYNALKAKLESKRESGIATLELYLTSPSAVADHSALVEEMEGLLCAIAEAEDALETLEHHFGEQQVTQMELPFREIEDTTADMSPGDLIKFAGYYEDWHIDEDVWKYGLLVGREGTDFLVLFNNDVLRFGAEHWYMKKV